MKTLISIITICAVILTTGCGQKGPLYLKTSPDAPPIEKAKSKQTEITIKPEDEQCQ